MIRERYEYRINKDGAECFRSDSYDCIQQKLAELKEKHPRVKYTIQSRSVRLDKNGVKALQNYGKINAGTVPTPPDCPNLIEVMACEGGCIAGPSVIMNPKVGTVLLNMYANAGSKELVDGIPPKCDMDEVIKNEK